jgi:hypothetical protein
MIPSIPITSTPVGLFMHSSSFAVTVPRTGYTRPHDTTSVSIRISG